MAATVRYVAVKVAGKPATPKLLHRKDCFHFRDESWPEPVLREATDEERRSLRKCEHCVAKEARESGT